MYGNINPHKTFPDNNRPFKHPLSLMGKNRDKLTDAFTDQQREMLEKYGGNKAKGERGSQNA